MATPNRSTMPIRHIAFIMDGNGRWAKARGLPRTMGHKAGIKRLKEIITFSLFNCGIFCCSFSCFLVKTLIDLKMKSIFYFRILKNT